MNSVKIVEEFWDRVWKARNLAAIGNLVVDDFVLPAGGVDVVSTKRDLEVAMGMGGCEAEWKVKHRDAG
jgi:hypothetical protein